MLAFQSPKAMGETPVRGEWSNFLHDYRWAKLTKTAQHYGYTFLAHDALEDTKATLHCFNAMLADGSDYMDKLRSEYSQQF